MIFLAAGNSFAQVNADVKTTLTSIIDLSKAKNYDEAGKLIAFYSDDKKKDYKIPVLTNKDQLNFVKRVVKKIGALTGVSTSYNIGTVTSKKEGTTDFQCVTVEFISGTQKISSEFKFVTIDKKLLLAEIE